MKDNLFPMYDTYLVELEKIQGRLPGEGTHYERFTELMDEPFVKIYKIFYKNMQNPVGFIAIGFPPNCHPAADYYIEEAYILPKFRKKGILQNWLRGFVEEHNGGVFCLFVLDKNKTAFDVWHKVFTSLRYVPLELSAIPGTDRMLIQLGFTDVK